MSSDVIVIGGGHNGLVAACYLARAGLDVLVVEAQSAVGGMTGTASLIPEAPDHRINFCAVDMVFIRGTGITEELQLNRFGYREIEVDPGNVYLHPDGASLAFWRDPARTADEIRQFSPADAEAYLDLTRVLDAALGLGFPLFSTNPRRPEPRALGRAAVAAARHRHQLGRVGSLMVSSAAQVIDERFRHPVVRDALATQAGVAAPIDADGSAMNLILLPFWWRFGTARPVGGTQALPDALTGALRAAGGQVRTGAPVAEIVVSAGRAKGVRLESGELITARRAVVATCDPRTALGKLLPAGTLDPVFDARVAHIPTNRDGYTNFKVDLALSGQLQLGRHQKLRRDGLDLRLPTAVIGGFEKSIASYRDARAGRIHPEPCMWNAIPTAVDPSQAPAGQDTLYLWANAMPVDPDVPWASLGAEAAKGFVTRAAEFYDGVEEMEIGRWVETPEEFGRRLRVTEGCLYHTDFSLLRLGPLRPAVGLAGYRTPVPGLYLGGSGSHPSPSVTGLPGRLCAREVLRRRPS